MDELRKRIEAKVRFESTAPKGCDNEEAAFLDGAFYVLDLLWPMVEACESSCTCTYKRVSNSDEWGDIKTILDEECGCCEALRKIGGGE